MTMMRTVLILTCWYKHHVNCYSVKHAPYSITSVPKLSGFHSYLRSMVVTTCMSIQHRLDLMITPILSSYKKHDWDFLVFPTSLEIKWTNKKENGTQLRWRLTFTLTSFIKSTVITSRHNGINRLQNFAVNVKNYNENIDLRKRFPKIL